MRLAVLLLLAMPACALAQTAAPSTKPASAEAKHAPTGADHKHAPAKPAPKPSTKPADAKPAAKPVPPKPAPAKQPPPKPVAKKPAAPAPHPAPVTPAPAPVDAPPAEPNKGTDTGLLLPRFAALRSDDVNFRTGPGTRYPIEWVYKRRDLPVEIEREFEKWRLIRDPQGNKGWVHQATLTTGRRTAVVAGATQRATVAGATQGATVAGAAQGTSGAAATQANVAAGTGPTIERVLRQAASDTSGPVAKLKPGVILRIRSCDANSEWCQAQIGDYRGYIKRSEIWGVTPDEVIQ